MANIDAEIRDFRNAVYGEQVRNSMISAFIKINNVVIECDSNIQEQVDLISSISLDITNYKAAITAEQNAFEVNINDQMNGFQSLITGLYVEYQTDINSQWTTYKNEMNAAEATRISQENTRVSQEQTRMSHEQTRVNQEQARQNYIEGTLAHDYTDGLKYYVTQLKNYETNVLIPGEQLRVANENIREQERIAINNYIDGTSDAGYQDGLKYYVTQMKNYMDNSTTGVKKYVTDLKAYVDGTAEESYTDGIKAYITDLKNYEISTLQANETNRQQNENYRNAQETIRQNNELNREEAFASLSQANMPLATSVTAGAIIIGDGFTREPSGRISVSNYGDLETGTHAATTYVAKTAFETYQNSVVNTYLSKTDAASLYLSKSSGNLYVLKTSISSQQDNGSTVIYDANDILRLKWNMTWNDLNTTNV